MFQFNLTLVPSNSVALPDSDIVFWDLQAASSHSRCADRALTDPEVDKAPTDLSSNLVLPLLDMRYCRFSEMNFKYEQV
jgi:hypothetical protein